MPRDRNEVTDYKKPEVERVNCQLIYRPGEFDIIKRFCVTTGRTKGEEVVKAMLEYIERERKEGRYV